MYVNMLFNAVWMNELLLHVPVCHDEIQTFAIHFGLLENIINIIK